MEFDQIFLYNLEVNTLDVYPGIAAPFHITNDSHFAQMIAKYQSDIVCLQETRCDEIIFNAIVDDQTQLAYRYINHGTNPARGRGSGYSGTAIFKN